MKPLRAWAAWAAWAASATASAATVLLVPWLLAVLPACTSVAREHFVVDSLVMPTAYRPPPVVPLESGETRYQVLAGDLHCHVSPPDSPTHVTRDLADTLDLARKERLDFVVLTPHVWSRFYLDDALRAATVVSQRELRAEIARGTGGVVVIPGLEYTDGQYGHAGLAFADVERVLEEVPTRVAREHPERFFERWVADGGLVVVNHPLLLPIRSSFSFARENLSWRPWTSPGPFPPEIQAIDRLAFGFEVYNLAVTELRDRHLVGYTDRTLLESMQRLDSEIVERGRRMTPVGGSDSHSHSLRATTFVLATERTSEAIHEALGAGRVCVRSPEACSFEARTPGGPWVGVGGAIAASDSLEVRASGDASFVVDGTVAARSRGREPASVTLAPGRCHVVRAVVGAGLSAPVYVGCGF
jgi:hypothetical protein